MNKFKEILFLKSLKRVGKVSINTKYWNVLNDANDFDDLIEKIKMSFNFSKDEINKAKQKSETLYNSIINNKEITIVTVFDEAYPKKLNVMKNKRPLILYIKGDVNALSKPNIAIIGTRKPSKISEKFEENLIKTILKSTDKAIVSGLALGCDKIAHQTTVNENKITIAILPSGVNVIKPASNKKLAKDIIESGGCLVSEYEPDTNVFKGTYVERDHVVAAFSDETFVIQSGIKSGTMHTVNAAKNYKRKIFTYIPNNNLSKEFYDGNKFILRTIKESVKIENPNDFSDYLKEQTNDLNYVSGNYTKNQFHQNKLNEKQKSYDIKKKHVQTTLNFN